MGHLGLWLAQVINSAAAGSEAIAMDMEDITISIRCNKIHRAVETIPVIQLSMVLTTFINLV